MAKIVLGSYMVRYPLGGILSWALQYLLGFHRLGHDVYVVEKAHYPNACFDPSRREMTDDGSFGLTVVSKLLERFGLRDRWCFVDYQGRSYGLARSKLVEIFRAADLFVDGGAHGSWLDEASTADQRVLIDGEPGYTQMKWEASLRCGEAVPEYDHYFSNGCLLGSEACSAPLAGRRWRPLLNPVIPELFQVVPSAGSASYTTVMNWRSHDPLQFGGVTYGQKDVEFANFLELPRRVAETMEVAVAGTRVPRERLRENGWRVRDAHEVTRSFDRYRGYLQESRGEFSVCKSVFVATRSGWFSDRSAAYLASGRPVVLQDTGFSETLPCGEGLFAVDDVEDASAAICEIEADYARHSRRAREIAIECLDARRVLGGLLDEIGL